MRLNLLAYLVMLTPSSSVAFETFEYAPALSGQSSVGARLPSTLSRLNIHQAYGTFAIILPRLYTITYLFCLLSRSRFTDTLNAATFTLGVTSWMASTHDQGVTPSRERQDPLDLVLKSEYSPQSKSQNVEGTAV